MILVGLFLNVHFIFISSSCMCVALEDTNPYVNFHLLSAIHFSHSTTIALNILQNKRPRRYGQRTKSNEDYRYVIQVLSKLIGTFFLSWYHFSLIFHFFSYCTIDIISEVVITLFLFIKGTT